MSEYKLIRAHRDRLDAEVAPYVAVGWVALGAPVFDPSDAAYLTQAIVRGVAAGPAVPAGVTIEYAASEITDGIEATITVVDADGFPIEAIHGLNVWVSDDADGAGLTATAASGALTAATGTILAALTAKKHVLANTDASGVLTLLLVDSANTVGERFCVAHPATGAVIVGDATVASDYEGGGG